MAEERTHDRQWLESWLQPQHLEPDALHGYRRAFTSHPARMIVVENLLAPQVATRLSRFLAAEADYSREYGLYSVEGAVDEARFNAADDQDRFFRYRKLVATPARFQMSPNALTYLQFRKAFQRPEFKAFFEEISGLSLGWSDDFGSHSMVEGDFLRPHSDDDRNRRLALVIYLSEGWQHAFGGQLRVVHSDNTYTEIEPQYNSMIAFDVLAAPSHLVVPIHRAAGDKQRLSIGGWYHNAD